MAARHFVVFPYSRGGSTPPAILESYRRIPLERYNRGSKHSRAVPFPAGSVSVRGGLRPALEGRMTIDMEVIEKAIKSHMEVQPYSAKCAECGEEIILDVTVDNDLDLRIVVPVCECQEGI